MGFCACVDGDDTTRLGPYKSDRSHYTSHHSERFIWREIVVPIFRRTTPASSQPTHAPTGRGLRPKKGVAAGGGGGSAEMEEGIPVFL